MRPLIAAFAALTLLAPLGLAFSSAAPAPAPLVAPKAAKAAPGSGPFAGVIDFPNCPAPAINGMNIRAARGADGASLTIFVVVQNVGNRAFFASSGAAAVHIQLAGQTIGNFPLEKLSRSEVKFFSATTTLPAGAAAGDVTASIDFAADALVGRVANTIDCQTSDNKAVRKGQSIRASLERSAG